MFLAAFLPTLIRVLLQAQMDPGTLRTGLNVLFIALGTVAFWTVLWSWKRDHDRRHEDDWPRKSR
jgi:hypothetical protein